MAPAVTMSHSVSTEIHIDAAPSVVWSILVDFDRFAEWNPFIVAARGDVAAGERVTLRLRPPGGRAITLRPKITRVEPGAELAWLGHLVLPGLLDGDHSFALRADGTGAATTLTQAETFRGVLVTPLRGSITRQTTAGMAAMNTALKARAERW